MAIDLTDKSKNVHERSEKRFLDICKQHCNLNCPKKYDAKYFPSVRTYNEVKHLSERRKFLLANNVDMKELQEFAHVCSRDPDI